MTIVNWAKFNASVAKFAGEVFSETLTWKKVNSGVSRYGEILEATDIHYVKCLVDYNYYRRWPIDEIRETGLSDLEYCGVYIHKDELVSKNLLTDNGNPKVDPGTDQFWIRGVEYILKGDTPVAQTTDPQLILLILHRALPNTANEPRP